MLDAGVEAHLVGDGAHLLEELLGLVALLFGEDLIGLCGLSLLVAEKFGRILDMEGVSPAAAMERGPVMPLISSSSTKDGCAV